MKRNVRIEPSDKAQEAIDAWHKECKEKHFSFPEPPKLVISRIEPTLWFEDKVDFIIHVDLKDGY